jgi:hypothetical protein
MTKPKATPTRREMTPEEMLREAERMQREMGADHEARMSRGPAVSLSSRMRRAK